MSYAPILPIVRLHLEKKKKKKSKKCDFNSSGFGHKAGEHVFMYTSITKVIFKIPITLQWHGAWL